jgi:hypothetical protein
MRRIGLPWLALGTGIVAIIALASAFHPMAEADEPQPLDGVVYWQPPIGEVRRLVFHGTIAGTAVQGTLDDGEKPVKVWGTVADDGSLSGRVEAQDGTVLGTFAGVYPESSAMQSGAGESGAVAESESPATESGSDLVAGTYTLGSESGGVWAASEQSIVESP